ncbi:hypothetical protein BJ742DRAFT_223632 [Cladochytrium replicatum]|nr:hypothetical protein BJ742DRAFT_223632 [Cladochytrium replicatum]
MSSARISLSYSAACMHSSTPCPSLWTDIPFFSASHPTSPLRIVLADHKHLLCKTNVEGWSLRHTQMHSRNFSIRPYKMRGTHCTDPAKSNDTDRIYEILQQMTQMGAKSGFVKLGQSSSNNGARHEYRKRSLDCHGTDITSNLEESILRYKFCFTSIPVRKLGSGGPGDILQGV